MQLIDLKKKKREETRTNFGIIFMAMKKEAPMTMMVIFQGKFNFGPKAKLALC